MGGGTSHPTCGEVGRGGVNFIHRLHLMADDIGFSDTGFGGSTVARTPHLDALARKAVHLTHFRAPVWCVPSRAAFLADRHGWEVSLAAAHGWIALGSDTLLLSELLREASYHTRHGGGGQVPLQPTAPRGPPHRRCLWQRL